MFRSHWSHHGQILEDSPPPTSHLALPATIVSASWLAWLILNVQLLQPTHSGMSLWLAKWGHLLQLTELDWSLQLNDMEVPPCPVETVQLFRLSKTSQPIRPSETSQPPWPTDTDWPLIFSVCVYPAHPILTAQLLWPVQLPMWPSLLLLICCRILVTVQIIFSCGTHCFQWGQ